MFDALFFVALLFGPSFASARGAGHRKMWFLFSALLFGVATSVWASEAVWVSGRDALVPDSVVSFILGTLLASVGFFLAGFFARKRKEA